MWLDRSSTWTNVISAYFGDETFVAGPKEVERSSWSQRSRQVKKRAKFFIFYDSVLYKRSYGRPLLHCVTLEMGEKILEEIHEGVDTSYIGRRALAVTTVGT